MKDSNSPQDRPQSHPEKADLAPERDSNGHYPDPASDPAGITPSASRWSEFQTWLKMRRDLLEITTVEEELGQLRDEGDMFRIEWKVDLALKVLIYVLAALVTLTIIGLEIALFIFSPGLFALNLLVGTGVAWRQIARWEKRRQQGDERDEDP